jgi:hypothetical protein
MEPWAFLGPIFAILGCLLRVSFFDTFFDRQEVDPKTKKYAKLAADGEPDRIFGAARRNERGHRGGDYGEGAEIFA